MWADRVIAALFVSAVVFAPRTGSADPATYEPGVNPGVGFNLTAWSNFGAAGEGVWEAAVQDIYDHGFRAVSISPLRGVDRGQAAKLTETTLADVRGNRV